MTQNLTDARAEQALRAITLSTALLCLWSLIYQYGGLAFDAQIYAVQALSKLRPSLVSDLFLQNVSQDRFTLFPAFYAWFIDFCGLRPAALLLTTLFTVWLLASSWRLVTTLTDSDLGWLATFFLVIEEGYYGAFGVFYISEPFLTARLPAEALVATAIACHFRGHARTAIALASMALVVHPLMAFPGLLLLVCVRLRLRTTVAYACVLIVGTFIATLLANNSQVVSRILPIMDSSWIYVVRERSQFLFLQQWRLKDWASIARPFLGLVFVVLTYQAGNTRNLAVKAAIVGATGIAIAAIGDLGGPVALLMQSQPWRWVWITNFASILLTLPSAYASWHGKRFGPVSAILLIVGWLLPAIPGVACICLALLILQIGSKLTPAWIRRARPVALIIVGALLLWSLISAWTTVSRLNVVHTGDSFLVACVRAVFTSKVLGAVLAGTLWWWIKSISRPLAMTAIIVILGALAATFLAESSRRLKPYGSPSDILEFTEWRNHMPDGSTVYVTNGYDSGSFVWFTLQRNNYLSTSQSAGVVFSRATALEVARRAEVLSPLNDRDWMILTSLQNRTSADSKLAASASGNAGANKSRHLTQQVLVEICRDPLLGFVVSPDDAGFDPIIHRRPGTWNNWKLYDCSHVRERTPVA